ncbi:MAG: hypothetical protein H0U87_07830 [Acidobacteria bacterium]|nr:hypothetical protein [Acidobacteriota bacterium]
MSERIIPVRYKFQLPVKIWFEPEHKTGKLQMPAENLFVWGETHDLSRSGIAFVVPLIRIKENYLVGAGTRPLNAELDLPNGRVQMQLSGRRYEQITDEHSSVSRYLIGASIEFITPENLETYEYFLKHGRRAEAPSGAFELGIDKG